MHEKNYPLYKNNYDGFLDGIIIAILNEDSAADVQNAESPSEINHESDQLFVSDFEKPGNESRKESIQKDETVSSDIIEPKTKQTEENSSHFNRSSISWITLAVPLAAVLIAVLAFVFIMIHRSKEPIPAESSAIQESAVVTTDDPENESTGTTKDDPENESTGTTKDDPENGSANTKSPQAESNPSAGDPAGSSSQPVSSTEKPSTSASPQP